MKKKTCKELSGGCINPCELCQLAYSPLCEEGEYLPIKKHN